MWTWAGKELQAEGDSRSKAWRGIWEQPVVGGGVSIPPPPGQATSLELVTRENGPCAVGFRGSASEDRLIVEL